MDDTDALSGKMAEVQHLSTALADRVLDAQIALRAVPPEQITALVSAARLLQDHDVPWPPLLEQVLHEFANRIDGSQPMSEAEESEREGALTGLSRLLGAFRREKGAGTDASSS